MAATDTKQEPSDRNKSDLIDDYNAVVEDMNRIELPA